jgi:hypothetical protein
VVDGLILQLLILKIIFYLKNIFAEANAETSNKLSFIALLKNPIYLPPALNYKYAGISFLVCTEYFF